jgi:Flp pilus assembly protein TadD
MHHFARFFAFFSATLSLAAFAQSAVKPAAVDAYRNEAVVFELYETQYLMHADGTGQRNMHVRLRVQSEGAARQFGVLSFAYASAYETPTIKMVRVRKPDGAVIDTPPADAIDMPSAVTREAPLYSDLKEKHLPVRSLSTGDTLEYEVQTSIDKAEAPSQFWGASHFTPPGTSIVLSEVLVLDVPKDKYVQVWSPNHTPTVTMRDGQRSYRWESSQLIVAPKKTNEDDDANKPPAPKDPDEDADGRKLPSVAWTTFRTWAEVGDWYRSVSLARAEPTDALRARAAEITKDAKTPDDQVRAIYEFVSTRTRYVGIDFGVGRFQPHPAAEVLANQYGDCKDKDTLLEALLRAKGFSTAPALIGAGIAPVPDVPSPAVFNHVITTVNLPGGMIWLDSTPEVAPFRYLSASIRDQLALVVPVAAPASLQRTPETAPYPFKTTFEVKGALDIKGQFTSKVTVSCRGDDELVVRALARRVAPAEWDKVSQYLSAASGFGGTTSNTSFTNSGDYSLPMVMSYDYSKHPYGEWTSLRIVPAFPVTEFSTLSSDVTAPEDDIELGAPRTMVAVSRIRLPEGFGTDLPDAVHVKTDFATFDKTYRFDGKEIVVERNIVVLKKKVPKSEWKKYKAFSKDIGLDGEPWIQLIASSNSAAKPAKDLEAPPKLARKSGSQVPTTKAESPTDSNAKPSAPGSTDDLSVADLMGQARTKYRTGDMDGALVILEKVKAKNPSEPYLWGMYGDVAFRRQKFEEAIVDYKKELSLHPENEGAVVYLASSQDKSNDSAGARQTLQSYLVLQPGNLRISLYLAGMQSTAGDDIAALKTQQTAAEHNPEDRGVRIAVANTYLRLGRRDEAAAAAKSALDGADDPMLLNNAAYALSRTGRDLPSAEEASRKAINLLEEKSIAITTAEANSKAFAASQLLVASWDTLGWILFLESKFDDAKPWIIASWRNGQRPEVGDHLAQIYEALGKKDEAMLTYSLAGAAIQGGNAPPETLKHINESIARLTRDGVKPGPKNATQILQDSRTYKIARSEGTSGWGTFRLQITATGVLGSQQLSGEKKLGNITQAIDAVKFPELVPPQSKAHLLRGAVVSCSSGATCELVLVPNSNLYTEQQ